MTQPAENLYWYKVREVISAYDGDSARLKVDVGFHLTTQISVRLARINAPELGNEGGKESRDFLRVLLKKAMTYDDLTVRTYKTEKWGRWLAELYIGTESISDIMVQAEHAVEYVK